jgi:hypothetical protein
MSCNVTTEVDMPTPDTASKTTIARFLFTARMRSLMDNRAYVGLTDAMEGWE